MIFAGEVKKPARRVVPIGTPLAPDLSGIGNFVIAFGSYVVSHLMTLTTFKFILVVLIGLVIF
jgi:hypothetical protein